MSPTEVQACKVASVDSLLLTRQQMLPEEITAEHE